MTTLEVLEKARDLIRDEKHWCRGKGRNEILGQRCATIAIQDASYPHFEESEAAKAVARRIAHRLDPDCYVIPAFNDTHTHAEVLELFNIAIAELQGEQCKATTGDQSATMTPPTATGSTSATTRSLSPA